MHFLRQIILLLSSRYVSYGLRMSLGVTVPAVVLSWQDSLASAIVASLGALCFGICDVPGTLSRRRNGILVGGLFIFLVSFITWFCATNTFLLFAILALFCMIFSMFSIYGGRASNIGTACLLAMVFSLEGTGTISGALQHSTYMLAGGLWYFLLSVALWQIRPYFSARQALGECLRETAEYIRTKASFYQDKPDFDKSFRQLVDIQVRINEKQEEVRELLLKRRSALHGSNSVSRSLVMIFIEAVDLLEQAMASHIDYRLLHARFGESGILLRYNQLILHMAEELENIAASVISSAGSVPSRNLQKEIETIRHEVDDLKESMLSSENIDGFIALKNILRNTTAIAVKIRSLHHYTRPHRKKAEPASVRDEQIDLARFASHQRYDLKIFLNNLTFDSSSFRHSLRVTMATLTGYLISLMFAQEHSSWILLTVIIIMKPAFGSTKKRIYERLLGTLLGGLAGVLILLLVKSETALIGILLFCIFMAFTLINYNYRLAVGFITPYVLILFQLLDPGNFKIAQERIMDTLIGGGIAFLASYLLWPSWEYMQLKTYMLDILDANREYFRQVAGAYTGRPLVRTEYKLARKQVHVSTANIASALQRMLSEPKSKHKSASEIYSFVVLNHTLSSHIATLAAHLQQGRELPRQEAFKGVTDLSIRFLEEAGAALRGDEGVAPQGHSAVAQGEGRPAQAATVQGGTERALMGGEEIQGRESGVPPDLPADFRLLKQKLEQLASLRLDELKAHLEESTTQAELSQLRLLFDTFSGIFNISAEIAKHSRKIRV